MDNAARLNELIDGAEELLIQLGDAQDPQIQRLRDRVDEAIGDARRSFAVRPGSAPVRLRDVARTIDDYIRDYPWVALATGVFAAGTAAFIAGALLGPRNRAAYE